jgi:hypothetical protein
VGLKQDKKGVKNGKKEKGRVHTEKKEKKENGKRGQKEPLFSRALIPSFYDLL